MILKANGVNGAPYLAADFSNLEYLRLHGFAMLSMLPGLQNLRELTMTKYATVLRIASAIYTLPEESQSSDIFGIQLPSTSMFFRNCHFRMITCITLTYLRSIPQFQE